MNQEKYIGMDVHQATISAAVRNAHGKLLMECVLETKAETILEFVQGLRGPLARSPCRVGWMSRIKSRLGSKQNFFLDILLIELIDPL